MVPGTGTVPFVTTVYPYCIIPYCPDVQVEWYCIVPTTVVVKDIKNQYIPYRLKTKFELDTSLRF